MDNLSIAKEAFGIESDIGLTIDDILNKLTQELGEFNDSVQKLRGRYCKSKGTLEDIKGEAGDLFLNFISICYRAGINPNDLPKLAENTLNKFKERKETYRKVMHNG